jgi:hypothetical protein
VLYSRVGGAWCKGKVKGHCSVTVGEQESGNEVPGSFSQAQLLSLVSICHTITASRLEENGADLAAKNRLQVLLIGVFFSLPYG